MYFPHELIIQILLRLPVKSLVRFKCVCKLWLTLISDTHFANSHFQITAATHTHRIMFISNSYDIDRFIDFEASLDQDTASVSLNLNFMSSESYFYNIEIKGSCRGIIFLYCCSNIYLWNPSTGAHKQIPLSPIESKLDAYCCYLYGFGYDQSRDDYLLVLMSYDTSLANISSHLEFFSLRDNVWKEIEGTNLPYMNASDDPRTGSLFNGAIHWLAFREDLSVNLIVAFDLMERKLLEMSLPDDFDHEPTFCDLWVFGDFLSLWAMGDDIVEIWVMKEYRVHSSWTKTLVLVLPIDGIPTSYFSPLGCTKSGQIVGTNGDNGLVKYDDKGQLLEHHSYCNDRSGSQLIMYTESLLSPPNFLSEPKKLTQTIRTKRRSTRRRRMSY
ncbi:F-box/kelch-repeat protein [Trifolium repens]|nr:F-box/kelch-repeat protein [Trifolium repens]